MSAEHGQVQRTPETETESESQMSSEAAGAAVAAANQQEWSEKRTESIDDLLDDIDQYLESEETVLNFKQRGGQ